jgi:hypothetical protein
LSEILADVFGARLATLSPVAIPIRPMWTTFAVLAARYPLQAIGYGVGMSLLQNLSPRVPMARFDGPVGGNLFGGDQIGNKIPDLIKNRQVLMHQAAADDARYHRGAYVTHIIKILPDYIRCQYTRKEIGLEGFRLSLKKYL